MQKGSTKNLIVAFSKKFKFSKNIGGITEIFGNAPSKNLIEYEGYLENFWELAFSKILV